MAIWPLPGINALLCKQLKLMPGQWACGRARPVFRDGLSQSAGVKSPTNQPTNHSIPIAGREGMGERLKNPEGLAVLARGQE